MTTPLSPGLSPSQTVGPFFLDCLLRPDARRQVLVQPETTGERLRLVGRVLDGDGAPVPDAMVELWQANAAGRYRHPADTRATVALDASFVGFGRAATDDDGRYWFETIKPGAVPFDAARTQAPHLGLLVFARGLLNHLATRVYFAGEPTNDADPVLRLVPAARRDTLLAQREPAAGDMPVYRFDLHLQGPGETVFFNV